jgi:hypothetical protein
MKESMTVVLEQLSSLAQIANKELVIKVNKNSIFGNPTTSIQVGHFTYDTAGNLDTATFTAALMHLSMLIGANLNEQVVTDEANEPNQVGG